MVRVQLKTEVIQDWVSFHAEFKRALGFPEFYGANMNAWIDCMSYLRDPDAGGMSKIVLRSDEILILEIPLANDFRRRLPEIVDTLWESTAFVNRRYVDNGESAAIGLMPVDSLPSRSNG